MLTHVLAVLGLGVACGAWIAVQRWIQRQDPEQPGVEGSKGCREGLESCEGCVKLGDCEDVC